MSSGDPRDRHATLFSAQYRQGKEQQSLSGTASSSKSIVASSNIGSSNGSTIKRRSAACTLAAMVNGTKSDSSSDSDTESSLNDIGSSSTKKSATKTSNVPKQTTPWNPGISYASGTKRAKASSSSISISRPVASTSQIVGRGTTIKAASQKTLTHSRIGTTPSAVYSSSTATTRNRANSPYKTALASGKGKGREKDESRNATKTSKVVDLDGSSSEEEPPLPVQSEKKKKKLRKGSDTTTEPSTKTKDRQDSQLEPGVVYVPHEPPEGGVPIPGFLFTPPTVHSSPPKDLPPISANSASSKENRNSQGDKQSSSKRHASARAVHSDIPEPDYRFKESDEQKPKDNAKLKKKKFTCEEADYKDDEDDGTSTTMSDGISASSTTSLRDQTSRAKIHTSSPKLNYTPNTQRALGMHVDAHASRTPAASGGRTPTVGRAIKSGTSASRNPYADPPQTVKRVTKKEEHEYLPSGNSGPARSSPPPALNYEETKPSRKARPAVTEKSVSRTAGSQGLERARASSSSSSSHVSGSAHTRQTSRKPLADKQVSSSSSKNTKANVKSSGMIYVEIESSPEKPPQSSSTSRRAAPVQSPAKIPITMSSSQHAGVAEDEEESFVVADSSTIRHVTIDGKKSRAPIQTLDIQSRVDKASRGQPSPVYGKARLDRPTVDSSTQRRKAPSAVKAPLAANGQQTKQEGHRLYSGSSRPTTPGKSSSRKEVELFDVPSVSPRKRPNRPEPSKDDSRREERRTKRRSVEREEEEQGDSLTLRRSGSPFEATQYLWNQAARGQGRAVPDFDMSLGLEDDSDDDVPLTDFKEKVLCPFCDRPLPPRPSRRLMDQLQKLCHRVDLQTRQSSLNSLALRLPPTDTASFCKRHKDEMDIIPAGEAAGYPKASSVNWREIIKRIHRDIISDLRNIVYRRSQSSFYDEVREECEEQGARKMGNVRNHYSTFYLELPGYYGQRGFQTILQALTNEFVTKGILTPYNASPMTVDVYLRRVLVPETAVRLIQVDQRCSRSKALKILEESRDYGAAVFGDMDTANSLLFKETQAERTLRFEEEEAAASQREDLLSSQGVEAEALKIGEALIAKLRKLCA